AQYFMAQLTTLMPTTHATRPASSSTRATVARSFFVTIAHTAVSTAPMPTQTAYAVPVGIDVMATARPAMLTHIDTAKRTLGHSFLKPLDAASALAQTASSAPETMRITHATTAHLSVVSLVAVRVLRPRPQVR